MESQIYDVCVIGLGIAGLTACLYLARQGLNIIAISKDIGGQLARVPLIENFPGTGPIPGIDLVRRVESEVRKYSNVKIELDEVTKVNPEGDHYVVYTARGREYRAYCIIVTSGKRPTKLGVENEDRYLGRGLSYCVICDAPLFKNKTVLYVSGTAPHVELSLDTLVNICAKVYWAPQVRPRQELLDKFASHIQSGKLEVLQDHKVVKLEGELKVEKVVLQDLKSGNTTVLNVDGVFVELGYIVSTDFIRDLVQVNERGEIIVDALCRTSREGIFAAGDVTNTPYKQAVIAAGQGAIAALSACEYLAARFGKKVRKVDWSTAGKKTTPFRINIKL